MELFGEDSKMTHYNFHDIIFNLIFKFFLLHICVECNAGGGIQRDGEINGKKIRDVKIT